MQIEQSEESKREEEKAAQMMKQEQFERNKMQYLQKTGSGGGAYRPGQSTTGMVPQMMGPIVPGGPIPKEFS